MLQGCNVLQQLASDSATIKHNAAGLYRRDQSAFIMHAAQADLREVIGAGRSTAWLRLK